MTTVKVLIDAVGPWNKGDIVHDAPPGLLEMAEKGTVNLATGERVAEIVDDHEDNSGGGSTDLKELKAKAKELKITGYGKMSPDDLKVAVEAAEKEIADSAELKELQAKAVELKIADDETETMSRDELVAEIALAERIKELHGKASELQIADFDKLSADELVAAIEAAGGGKGAE